MTSLYFSKAARLSGCFLMSSIALIMHAKDWIITGAGPTVTGMGGGTGPEWGVTGSYATLQAGDTFIFATDVWTSGNIGALAGTRPFQFQHGNYE
jgi:hypothetical protein